MKAFPVSTVLNGGNEGMDLRDYFAAKAMQGFISQFNDKYDQEVVSKISYSMADAMMKAREQ